MENWSGFSRRERKSDVFPIVFLFLFYWKSAFLEKLIIFFKKHILIISGWIFYSNYYYFTLINSNCCPTCCLLQPYCLGGFECDKVSGDTVMWGEHSLKYVWESYKWKGPLFWSRTGGGGKTWEKTWLYLMIIGNKCGKITNIQLISF